MDVPLTTNERAPQTFRSDDDRWAAVLHRNRNADGVFYFSVRTTGVYCRPSCPARSARRENVRFHSTREAAVRAGFRPCKRCRPDAPPLAEQRAAAVAKACRLIEAAEALPNLDLLAEAAGMSRFHFHRVFKTITGVTPEPMRRPTAPSGCGTNCPGATPSQRQSLKRDSIPAGGSTPRLRKCSG